MPEIILYKDLARTYHSLVPSQAILMRGKEWDAAQQTDGRAGSATDINRWNSPYARKGTNCDATKQFLPFRV
jgi:hypothetical protein